MTNQLMICASNTDLNKPRRSIWNLPVSINEHWPLTAEDIDQSSVFARCFVMKNLVPFLVLD